MILELIIMSSKIMIVVTCKFCHEWNPNMVIKHFMVSATYVPSQDVLEQQTTETANYSALTRAHFRRLDAPLALTEFNVRPLHASYCYRSFSGSRQAQSGGRE